MPEGATSLDLQNDMAFNNYLEANVRKWYEFVYRVRGQSIANGQLRLVTGCDKTTAWGIATVLGVSHQRTTKLKFKALDITSSSATTYAWECSGMVEVRVGPDRDEIEALRDHDNGAHLDMKHRNQCLFVRTMTATLSGNDWAKLKCNFGRVTVEDANKSSGTISDPSLGSRPSGSGVKSSEQPNNLDPWGQGSQGTPGTKSYSTSQESGIIISTMPNSPLVSIPSHNTVMTRK